MVLFQLTRPRGARPQSAKDSVSSLWFQLTRPRGARPYLPRPTWPKHTCFNSRAREERDWWESHGVDVVRRFQLTRPRGARHMLPCGTSMQLGFNSRAREGRDRVGQLRVRRRAGFNSRAREGRDVDNPPFSILSKMFQLTRPRGARRWTRCWSPRCKWVSTHVPARGATDRPG